MHRLIAPAPVGMTLVVTVDPLRVPRGHRVLPRGGVHATPRRPNRSSQRRALRRQLARES